MGEVVESLGGVTDAGRGRGDEKDGDEVEKRGEERERCEMADEADRVAGVAVKVVLSMLEV